MLRPPLGARLRYRFDNAMSRGTPALVGLLALVSLVLVVVVGVVSLLFADDDVRQDGIGKTLWMSLMRAMDPGAVGGDEANGVFLALMLFVTVGGLFIVAALVGVLGNGLDSRLEQLRKGRSQVIERGHTVLLGWSEHVFTVIAELVAANESERRACVVVLADRDKVEMEDELRNRLATTGTTRIVCRSGNPASPTDLDIVGLRHARAVVVLPPDAEQPDALVIKTLLALSNREWGEVRPHVVASIADTHNLAAARLAGGRHATVIDAEDVAARLVVQTSRQAGLSVICTDLLDFGGDEIYMRTEPALAGAEFGAALHAYETATAIGLCHPDGSVVLNPPMHQRIHPGDQVIVLAEDDSTIRLATRPPQVVAAAIGVRPDPPAPAERILILGWNRRAAKIVEQLDNYVAADSHVQIAAPWPFDETDLPALRVRLRRLHLDYKEVDITDRVVLEALNIGVFDHVIVLADDRIDPELADSHTLVVLLHLRDMETVLGERYSIVSEINDERNRKLAQITEADDFVVSGQLLSLLMTQIAENRHLSPVFTRLFDAEGSEIYLKPAAHYVGLGRPLTFATVIEAARQRGETAIGFRLAAHSHQAPGYGVHLNPPKDAPLLLDYGDRVIVLAED